MSQVEKSGFACLLKNRALIFVAGRDAFSFLQNLITQDMALCQDNKAIWTALLTAQGRILWDFFIYPDGENRFLIDCEASEAEKFGQTLMKYKLRSDIQMDFDERAVACFISGSQTGSPSCFETKKCISFADPRHKAMGIRFVGKPDDIADVMADNDMVVLDENAYLSRRMMLGLPEGHFELPFEQALPMPNGFDALEAISWDKGCYPGQEITARTKYRGRVKKHLMIFEQVGTEKTEIKSGTEIFYKEQPAGHIICCFEGRGIVMVRLDLWNQACDKTGRAVFQAGDKPIHVAKPDWFAMKEPDYA